MYPNQAIETKNIIPKIRDYFISPTGTLDQIKADTDTEKELLKNREHDQEKFFRHMEKILLESFVNTSVKLKEVTERMMAVKKKNIELGLDLHNQEKKIEKSLE